MDILQNIRQYLVITFCLLAAIPMLFCFGHWFYTSPRRSSLHATLNRQFRSLPPGGKLLAVVFLATFIAMGSTKTNNVPPPSPPPGGIVFDDGLQMEPEDGGMTEIMPEGLRLTTNQYLAGFALVRVATNVAPFSLIPTNALAESYWTRYGVAEDTFWLPATNWAFTLGTNQVEGLHVSSSGTLSFDSPKGSPRAREMPDSSEIDFLAPLQTAIGIAPPVGRFWHAPTSSNSLLLTWQDVYINRNTNYPITFQSELFRNGDFTFRYAFTNSHTPTLPHALTNFVIGAQHNSGGETYAFGDTNRLVNGLELRWRAFGLLDPGIDDHDGDGLSTYDEVMVYDGDPRLPDTDLDGLPDAVEAQLGTRLSDRDTDGDGIPDGSDPDPLVPNATDADGDGLPDAWELYRFGSTNATDSASADSDDDGVDNLAEMLIGSDPAFAACAVSASEGAHAFTWTDLPDATGYTLSVARNGMAIWSCATNVCSLTLANAFRTGDCMLTVASQGGVTSRTATVSFATPAAPNLTVWRIAEPLALVTPPGDGIVLERTFIIARDGGWQQFFISSSPDGAGAWSLEHLRLDWSDSAGASGSATASPSGDSLRLALSTNSPQTLTIRLVATGTNLLARSTQSLYLLGWSPAVNLVAGEGATLADTTKGPMLAVVTDLGGAATAASFTVDREGRPCNAPPSSEELSNQFDPFAPVSGAGFTGSYGASGELTGGNLLAGACGIFPLLGGGGYAPTSGGGGTQPGSPAAPSGDAVLFAPIVSQLFDHQGGCPCDGSDCYPFDSACLREDWRNAGGVTVSTGVSVSLGDSNLNTLLTVTINEVEGLEYNWDGETSVNVVVTADGVEGEITVWECTVEREPDEYSGDCHDTWEAASCGACGDCADCNGTEGDSSPLRFREPLGNTGNKQMAGFIWFDMETPQAITPGIFQVNAAPGVALTYGSGGTLNRATCNAPGGRDITITAMPGGVRLSIKDAGAAEEEFSWTIMGSGGPITFLREDNSNPANTLRHATYSYADGVWTCTDHLAGASETLETTDYPPDDEQDAWEKSEWLTFTAAGQILSSSWKMRTLIGEGEVATWRETRHAEWDGQANGWRNTYMSYWQDNLNPLVNGLPKTRTSDDGSWEYRQYDERGRETLRAEPLDGSSVFDNYIGGTPTFSISNGAVYSSYFDAIVTTTSYVPLSGDSGAWQDSRQPRETCRYAVKNGIFTLTAREWNVFSRGTNDGWPTLTRVAVRAATAGAAFADTANARSVSVSVIDDADVPVLMRGRPLCEAQSDGTLRTWSYLYWDFDSDGTNDVLDITTRTGTTTHTNGLPHVSTYTFEQLDAVFGRMLYRDTRLHTGGAGDPALDYESRQYDGKGRHIRSDFSDGTSEENTWGCCRLESSRGRDGSCREYLAIPGEDRWSAVAEISLGSLPGANGRYPVSESFTDALGRETNSARTVWHDTSRDSAYTPLQTRTEYPYGTDHYRIVTDPLGVQTISRNQCVILGGKYRLIDETVSAGVTNRTIMIPGAAPIEERFWRDPVSGDARTLLRRTETAWAANGNAISSTSVSRNGGPAASETVSESDFLGRVIASSRIGASGAMLVTSNFYDGSGRLVRTRNPDGSSVVHAYDALGKQAALIRIGAGQTLQFDPQSFALADVIALDAYVIDETSAWKESTDLGLSAYAVPTAWWNCTAAISYGPGQGSVTTTVTRTQLTGLSSSCAGRTVTTDPHGTLAMTTTAIDIYDASRTTTRLNLVTEAAETAVALQGYEIDRTDALGANTAFLYDGFARQTSAMQTTGDRTLQNLNTYHSNGTLATSIQVCGNATYTNAYSMRQPLQSPDGAFTVTETDPLGNQTVRFYAADSAEPYRSEGAVYPTAHVRDADGRKTELHTWRDQSGAPDVTRWHNDQAGLVTNKVYADGQGPSYAYLTDGRQASRIWARGVTTTYSYSDNADGGMRTTQHADATPGVTNCIDLAGRLVAVDDAAGSRTFVYDALSRLAAETNALAVMTRMYDTLGRGAGYDLAIPGYLADAFAVRCDHDAYGRLDSVTSVLDGVTNVFRYSYLEGSAILSGLTNGAGAGWSRTYEPHRDLIVATSNRTASATISSFQYDSDAAGRRTRRIDSGTVTNLFGYNARSEVVSAENSTNSFAYAYDGIGNRISSTVSAPLRETLYTANSLNQYTAIAGGATNNPVYDADGNMLTNGVWSYIWDAENRLINVASNGTPVVTNAYDYLNRRVTKTTAATVTRFIWDGWNIAAQIDIDRQTGATNVTCYVWGLDLSGTMQGAGGVGGLLAVIRQDGTFYPCYDANGNVTDYVNATGNVVARDEFDVFANITARSGTMADAFAFRFSTKYFDTETGLVMYQLRPYSPPLGRWLFRDPLEEQGSRNLRRAFRLPLSQASVNLYSMCFNRPVTTVDYLGLLTVVTGDCGCWSANALESVFRNTSTRSLYFDPVVNLIREPFKTAIKNHFDSMTFECKSDIEDTECRGCNGYTRPGTYKDIAYSYTKGGMSGKVDLPKLWRTNAVLCRDSLQKYDISSWVKTAIHETAHAIGWGGHYDDDEDAFDNMWPKMPEDPNGNGWGIPRASK